MTPPIIDGYKLWTVTTDCGSVIEIAAVGGKGVLERAAARDISVREQTIGFHPLYRKLIQASDVIDKQLVYDEITNVIYQDIADYP